MVARFSEMSLCSLVNVNVLLPAGCRLRSCPKKRTKYVLKAIVRQRWEMCWEMDHNRVLATGGVVDTICLNKLAPATMIKIRSKSPRAPHRVTGNVQNAKAAAVMGLQFPGDCMSTSFKVAAAEAEFLN
jgi:hypothetical protein